MSTLIIVESPTKARTISQFLAKDYIIESSFGHVRDLPQKYFGIDVAHDFAPKYSVLPKAKERVAELKKKAAKADAVILATDEDREGEAIAWHLTQALRLGKSKSQKQSVRRARDKESKQIQNSQIPNIQRIVFHEITKRAIEEALKNPRAIDMKLVDAQQARRVLDRIVGYKLSPFLWRKVMKGLSAGRVQSVAVRLVVEREREIEGFKPREYWSIEAELRSQKSNLKSQIFAAKLIKVGEKTLEQFDIKNKEDAEKILGELDGAEWEVQSVKRQETKRNPPPPFTTSTLQQAAAHRLHYSAKQTMRLAQQLYEGVEIEGKSLGLITYMRTDSLSLSEEFLGAAQEYIRETFGTAYTSGPRRYKTAKKGAQEAHEAVRPTDVTLAPDAIKNALEPRLWKLYDLIWRRSVASQMEPAVFDTTTVDVKTEPRPHTFRATGITMKFDGFLRVWLIKTEEKLLPDLAPNETLACAGITPEQHFTQPPPRFTEATLVRTLEEYGIGRPSTYAPILSTIQDRGYVEKQEKRFLHPTDIGKQVNDMLVEHFPEVVDAGFTATMEEELDEIAQGKTEWVPVVRKFWDPFAANLEKKYAEVKTEKVTEETGEMCEQCGKPLVIRQSRFGKFIACSGYPECKNTKSLPKESLGIACQKCAAGEVVERRTKTRRVFYGCSRWPSCDFASWQKPNIKQETTEP